MTQRLDPLLWLVLIGAIGLLLPHLPITVIPLLLVALIWRRLHEVRGWPLPIKPLLLLLALASFVLVLSQFHAFWGRDAGGTLLVMAAGLKLLETRQARDHYTVFLLTFFLLVTVLLFDQAPLIFALVALLFWLLVGAWIGVSQPTDLPIGLRMRQASRLLLAGLPFALVLFVLFPRPPGGLWGVQQPAGQALTGLSEQMRPGEFDHLAENPAPAFWVRFEADPIPPEARYWRVYVMSGFVENDRESWLADAASRSPRLETIDSSEIRYEITLEPTGISQLPSLAAPVEAPNRSHVDASLIIHRQQPVNDRLRYSVTSATDYRLDVGQLSRFRQDYYLRTGGLNPLLTDLARGWRDLPPSKRIERALSYFRDNTFRYTRSPGRREGSDRADAFLFDTRAGYCADYADAFVRLMRAAKVPARVVTGYQGGEVRGDYLVVRQSDAHAWAEVWLADRGWLRIDPTAVIAPERIETGVADVIRADESLSALVRRDPGSIDRLARLWTEQLDNRWNQYVLGYDGRLQLKLFGWLGLSASRPWWTAFWAIALAGLTWWSTLKWLSIRERRRLAGSEVDYRWECLQEALRRLGVIRRLDESERALLNRAATALPWAASDLSHIAPLLVTQRYARHSSRRQERLLAMKLASLHRRLRWRSWWRRKVR
ncbi:MAG TPA: DUF3488 and transglutaminase-like domain-containing protein [Guyparkeria sp.]|nr:DUF3488 and transglutaminase-like domain-containing protein [Guyparkeria sp.]